MAETGIRDRIIADRTRSVLIEFWRDRDTGAMSLSRGLVIGWDVRVERDGADAEAVVDCRGPITCAGMPESRAWCVAQRMPDENGVVWVYVFPGDVTCPALEDAVRHAAGLLASAPTLAGVAVAG